MLRLRFPDVPGQDLRLHGFRTWVPRKIGFLAALGVSYAFYRASLGYTSEHAATQELLRSYAIWCLAGAVAFLTAAWARRFLSLLAYGILKNVAVLQQRYTAPVVNLLNVRSSADEVYGTLDFKDLEPLTRWLLYAALALAVLLFVVFVLRLQEAAPMIGSAAIVLLAATGWIAAGSVLDFIGMRLRFPVLVTLLALAVLFSLWNDNHAVRTLPEPQIAESERADLRAALRSWMARQQYRLTGDQDKYPIYLVNAEGGGIRAAYWTATVLGEIQDRNPCFADQLFSLSGVSGGSLGSAVFVALLANQRAGGGAAHCSSPPGGFSFKKKAQDILGEDFLSPVVASMLYQDLVQRILFWPIETFDRALALEGAWERAWRMHVPGANRFEQPLDRLWENKGAWTPALFLNATWVETGKRLIVSNVRLLPRDPAEIVDFVDTEDALRFFAPRSLSLSTAVHLSARFTYISPAGTLVRGDEVQGRVVDGGYFENSGATTTLEILKIIDLLAEADPKWARVEPTVIHISNEPVDPSAGRETLQAGAANSAIAPRWLLNEVRSPLLTLYNTRGARGVYARETVRWQVGWSNFLQFGLCRQAANIPLGWVLSTSTHHRMEKQLLEEPCNSTHDPREEIFDNPKNLRSIGDRLSPKQKLSARPGGNTSPVTTR